MIDNNKLTIVGAGLTGLIASTQWPHAPIFEAAPPREPGHKALLRFRSPAVGEATGIPFRQVRVHKGLWIDGAPSLPTIWAANNYSMKVTGRLGDRSIWHLDPVDRWVAPDDFQEQLTVRASSRITWNHPVDLREQMKDQPMRHPVVYTGPMGELVLQLGLKKHPTFTSQAIHVDRFKVPNADVFQTLYFPSPETPVYRASITGDVLIVESMFEPEHKHFEEVWEAFGIQDCREHVHVEQRYGKILPLSDELWRRQFISEATKRLNVYSLGRFAVWKNILADDVLKDIAVIKRLLTGDEYAARMAR